MDTARIWEKGRKYIVLALFVIVAIVFASVYDAAALKALLERYDKYALVICLLVYLLLSVTPIPTEPVALLVLAWRGPLAAILMATLGNTLAALIEYYIGGSIGDLTDFEKKKEKLPFHLGRLPIKSPLFQICARMLPGFGPKFVSVAGGMYQVPLITYLWTATLANLIGAAVMVGGAYGVFHLFR